MIVIELKLFCIAVYKESIILQWVVSNNGDFIAWSFNSIIATQ